MGCRRFTPTLSRVARLAILNLVRHIIRHLALIVYGG